MNIISTKQNLLRYIILCICCLSASLTFAQNDSKPENKKIYNTFMIDIESIACNQIINKDEKIIEFSNTQFSLDLKKNILFITELNKENSKVIEFSLNNSKLIFKDQEEYGKLEAYLLIINDLPVLKFKDHSDDCFFFLVNFSK